MLLLGADGALLCSRGDALAAAVEWALQSVSLPDEKALREHFGLVTNPQLEDVAAGDWQEALSRLSGDALCVLRKFL